MSDEEPSPRDPVPLLRRVTISAFAIAAMFALTTGLALFAATHRPSPSTVLVDRAVAGWEANCDVSVQIAVDFATDATMEAHQDQIRAYPDVVDVSATLQHDNASRHRMLLAALAAGPEGYEQLVRDTDQPATLWVLLANGSDYNQFAALLRIQLGPAARDVRIEQPCLTANSLGAEVDRLRDYPTRCLIPITDPAGEVEIPAGCPPIP